MGIISGKRSLLHQEHYVFEALKFLEAPRSKNDYHSIVIMALQGTSRNVSARPYAVLASEYTQVSIMMPIDPSRYRPIRLPQARARPL